MSGLRTPAGRVLKKLVRVAFLDRPGTLCGSVGTPRKRGVLVVAEEAMMTLCHFQPLINV
jgi:hypothetical protein